MTVSVNSPVERRSKAYDDMDIILKGIGIATQFYGQKLDNEQRADLAQREQNRHKEQMTQTEALKNREFDYQVAKDKEAGLYKAKELAQKDRELGIKERESGLRLASKSGGLGLPKLNAAEKGKLDNTRMAYIGVKDMEAAMDAGENTFSLFGDNNFTKAEKNFTEGLGRLQSQGAITDDEVAKFESMAPNWRDSPEIQKSKLLDLKTELESRFATLGIDHNKIPEIANWKPKVLNKDASKAIADTKPKAPEDMTDAELDAKLKQLKGTK